MTGFWIACEKPFGGVPEKARETFWKVILMKYLLI